VARKAGLSERAISQLSAGEPADDLSDAERIAQKFATQLTASRRIDDDMFASAKEMFGPKGVMDITSLIGAYQAVCGRSTASRSPRRFRRPLASIHCQCWLCRRRHAVCERLSECLMAGIGQYSIDTSGLLVDNCKVLTAVIVDDRRGTRSRRRDASSDEGLWRRLLDVNAPDSRTGRQWTPKPPHPESRFRFLDHVLGCPSGSWEPTRNQEEQQYAAYHASLLRPGIAGRISTDWNWRDGND
jgi:hypothetical protein